MQNNETGKIKDNQLEDARRLRRRFPCSTLHYFCASSNRLTEYEILLQCGLKILVLNH